MPILMIDDNKMLILLGIKIHFEQIRFSLLRLFMLLKIDFPFVII